MQIFTGTDSASGFVAETPGRCVSEHGRLPWSTARVGGHLTSSRFRRRHATERNDSLYNIPTVYRV